MGKNRGCMFYATIDLLPEYLYFDLWDAINQALRLSGSTEV